MQERRKIARTTTLLAGTIVFGRGRSADCVVRDLSTAGARISCSAATAAELPEEFELHLPSRGRAHRVKARWRVDRELGVSFEGAAILMAERLESTA
jgi:hypothetical protein